MRRRYIRGEWKSKTGGWESSRERQMRDERLEVTSGHWFRARRAAGVMGGDCRLTLRVDGQWHCDCGFNVLENVSNWISKVTFKHYKWKSSFFFTADDRRIKGWILEVHLEITCLKNLYFWNYVTTFSLSCGSKFFFQSIFHLQRGECFIFSPIMRWIFYGRKSWKQTLK